MRANDALGVVGFDFAFATDDEPALTALEAGERDNVCVLVLIY